MSTHLSGTSRSQLENNDKDKVSLEHCLSTGNPGEFARGLRIEEIVFLIDEREENFQQKIILVTERCVREEILNFKKDCGRHEPQSVGVYPSDH